MALQGNEVENSATQSEGPKADLLLEAGLEWRTLPIMKEDEKKTAANLLLGVTALSKLWA